MPSGKKQALNCVEPAFMPCSRQVADRSWVSSSPRWLRSLSNFAAAFWRPCWSPCSMSTSLFASAASKPWALCRKKAVISISISRQWTCRPNRLDGSGFEESREVPQTFAKSPINPIIVQSTTSRWWLNNPNHGDVGQDTQSPRKGWR